MVSTVTLGNPPSFSPPRVLFSLDRPIEEMDVMPDGEWLLIGPAAPPDFAPLLAYSVGLERIWRVGGRTALSGSRFSHVFKSSSLRLSSALASTGRPSRR